MWPRRGQCDRRRVCPGPRKAQSDGGPFARDACNLEIRVLPLRDSINHRESQTGAALPFRREERLETAAARLLVHANTGIRNFDANAPLGGTCPHGKRATLWHRVGAVEDEVREGFPNFTLTAGGRGQLRIERQMHFDYDPPLHRDVMPSRPRKIGDLPGQFVQIDRLQYELRLTAAVKFP